MASGENDNEEDGEEGQGEGEATKAGPQEDGGQQEEEEEGGAELKGAYVPEVGVSCGFDVSCD